MALPMSHALWSSVLRRKQYPKLIGGVNAEMSLISNLFGNSEDGAFFAPWDTTSLYQSRTGGENADADDDPVGIMLDKSRMSDFALASQYITAQPELVSNGTFDSDITGWTGAGGATGSWSSGKLRVAGGGATGGRYQDVSSTSDTYVIVRVDARKVSGSSDVKIQIYESGGFSQLLVEQTITSSTEATYTYIIRPSTAGVRVYVQAVLGDGIIEADNISVKEIPGNHAVATSDGARPPLKISNGAYWLEPDGSADRMNAGVDILTSGTSDAWEHVGAWRLINDPACPFGLSDEQQSCVYVSGALRWYTAPNAAPNTFGTEDEEVDFVLGLRQSDADTVEAFYNGNAYTGSSVINPYDGSGGEVYNLHLFSRTSGAADVPFNGRFYGGVWVNDTLTAAERSQAVSFFL